MVLPSLTPIRIEVDVKGFPNLTADQLAAILGASKLCGHPYPKTVSCLCCAQHLRIAGTLADALFPDSLPDRAAFLQRAC